MTAFLTSHGLGIPGLDYDYNDVGSRDTRLTVAIQVYFSENIQIKLYRSIYLGHSPTICLQMGHVTPCGL